MITFISSVIAITNMQMASLRKPLFGKDVELALWGMDEKLAQDLLEGAYEKGRKLEKIFNFFDEKSVLSALNKKRRMECPEELLSVVKKALEVCRKTGGRYDISLGRQFLARKSGKPAKKPGCSYEDLRITGKTIELTHPEAMVDLGSIAKGYIGDEMASFLRSEGALSGLVDARGDIISFGEPKIVEIQHPREDRAIASIKLDGAVATSGDYAQLTYQNPHILDGKGFISVTTISKTLMEADAYATAVFVTPEEEIMDLLAGTGVRAMCVRKDLSIAYHNGFEGCLA